MNAQRPSTGHSSRTVPQMSSVDAARASLQAAVAAYVAAGGGQAVLITASDDRPAERLVLLSAATSKANTHSMHSLVDDIVALLRNGEARERKTASDEQREQLSRPASTEQYPSSTSSPNHQKPVQHVGALPSTGRRKRQVSPDEVHADIVAADQWRRTGGEPGMRALELVHAAQPPSALQPSLADSRGGSDMQHPPSRCPSSSGTQAGGSTADTVLAGAAVGLEAWQAQQGQLWPAAAPVAAGPILEQVLQSGGRSQLLVDHPSENFEDGYRWRKYGRKAVAGTQYLRHYYKCTTGNCPVRKHVERCTYDARKILVTYDNLPHNHAVPASAVQRTLMSNVMQPGAAAAAAGELLAASAAASTAASNALLLQLSSLPIAPPPSVAATPVPALWPAAAGSQPSSVRQPARAAPPAAQHTVRSGGGGVTDALIGPHAQPGAASGSAFKLWAQKARRPLPPLGRGSTQHDSAESAPATRRLPHAAVEATGDSDCIDALAAVAGGCSDLRPVAAPMGGRRKAPRLEGSTSSAAGADESMDAQSTGTDVQLFEEVIEAMHNGRRGGSTRGML